MLKIKNPYTVIITRTKEDIHVSVNPQPIAEPEAMKMVSRSIQDLVISFGDSKSEYWNFNLPNTKKMKKDLESKLYDFQKQGLIHIKKEQ